MTGPTSKTKRKHGQISSTLGNREDGRKIDTWSFSMPKLEGGGDSFKVEFDVALLQSMEIVVKTKDIDPTRFSTLRSYNIKELRVEAEEAARQEFDLRNQLTWSDWLEVRVEESSAYARRKSEDGACGQLQVAYSPIARGETPDGRAFTVSSNHSSVLVAFPTDLGVDRDVDGMSGSRRKSPALDENTEGLTSAQILTRKLEKAERREANVQFTYLPDTAENRAGLDAIIVAIESLSSRLQSFLTPTEIQATLSKAASQGTALLTGPANDEAVAPRKRPSP